MELQSLIGQASTNHWGKGLHPVLRYSMWNDALDLNIYITGDPIA